MLYVYVVQLVIILSVSIYFATHNISDTGTMLKYAKVANSYDKEEIIAKAVLTYRDNLIGTGDENTTIPTISDLKTNKLLASSFDANNAVGSPYSVSYSDANVNLCSNFSTDAEVANTYKLHYKGNKYGLRPTGPNNNICHLYPFTIPR